MLVVALVAYPALILVLRISGKRTLSKLNAFDFVVTVALGSTLASMLTSKTVPLADGMLTLGMLVVLQYLVSFTAVRVDWFEKILKSEPSLVLRGGELLRGTMRRERVTPDEVLSAIRDAGGRSFESAEVVYLETDGALTAILKRENA